MGLHEEVCAYIHKSPQHRLGQAVIIFLISRFDDGLLIGHRVREGSFHLLLRSSYVSESDLIIDPRYLFLTTLICEYSISRKYASYWRIFIDELGSIKHSLGKRLSEQSIK